MKREFIDYNFPVSRRTNIYLINKDGFAVPKLRWEDDIEYQKFEYFKNLGWISNKREIEISKDIVKQYEYSKYS